MLNSKLHIFYYLFIFPLVGVTYSLRGMEGLGAPGPAETHTQLADIGAEFALSQTLDAELINEMILHDIDVLEAARAKEHLKKKRTRASDASSSRSAEVREQRKRRRIFRLGQQPDVSQHSLIEAIGNTSFPDLEDDAFHEIALFLSDPEDIPSDVLEQAFFMAVSRGLTGVALAIFNPGDLEHSLLNQQALGLRLLNISNARNFELIEKVLNFRDPVTGKGINPNIFVTMFDRAFKNRQYSIAESLADCYPLDVLLRIVGKINDNPMLAERITNRVEQLLLLETPESLLSIIDTVDRDNKALVEFITNRVEQLLSSEPLE